MILRPVGPPRASDSLRATGESAAAASGEHELLLATGSIAQQGTLALSTLTMLVVFTALARTLSTSALGVYGLLLSIPAYLVVAQSSVETAAIKAIAEARDARERDRAFTTAFAIYAGFGLIAGLAIVFGGSALLGVFDIPAQLHHDARLGLIALGVLNVAGWPAKTFQDVLRANKHFVEAAAAEAAAYLIFGAAMAAALVEGEPLWLIAGLGGAIPLLIGILAAVTLVRVRTGIRLRASTLSAAYSRAFLSTSAYLLVSGIADLVVYALDRTVLAAFRPVAAVGLYEGPVRARNLARQLQGTLGLTTMPAAAAYLAAGDQQRLRELLVRGTRYVVIIMTPLTVTLIALASPILTVWLGHRYATAAPAMSILVGYWLLGSATAVGGATLIACGRARTVAAVATAVAGLNLALALALTPPFGLVGIAVATTASSAVAVPVLLRIVCTVSEVPARELVREAFLPALVAGACLASVYGALALALPLDRPAMLVATVAAGLAVYGIVAYAAFMRPNERLLIRTVLRAGCSRLSFGLVARNAPDDPPARSTR